jgi:outer membrane receptor protein involved in Fe transport
LTPIISSKETRMTIHPFSRTVLAAAVSVALTQVVVAQTAAEPAREKTGLDFEKVVVTATAQGGSKMKQSLSVSSVDGDQIQKFGTPSAAEVLRSIPGIRAESSGGEGNANVIVRGTPLSAGGSRYFQFQEDGLPVILFGDIAFGTADSFVKADGSIDRVEVVRGGSASTLATNSPGGVVNFLSKTGEDKGGGVGLGLGLDYKSFRADFDYGNQVSKETRYFVGGYYRTGEGVRPSNVTGEEGGQLKANITHDFGGGYVRLSLKGLDDKAPTHLPVPVSTVNGNISALPGVDPRTATFYTPYWNADTTLDHNNNLVKSNINDGLRVRSGGIGLEGAINLGNGFKVENRFRTTSNSGRFIGVFAADNGTQGTYTIASGPDTGKSWTGRAFNATVFNTAIDDLGLTQNEIKVSNKFAMGGDASLTATGGLYYAKQNVGLTWNFNQYLMQAQGENAALLSSSATSATTPGLLAFGTQVFGGCCNRYIDASYKTIAPFVAVGYEAGPLNLDGSVRFDKQNASGSFNQAVNQKYDPTKAKKIDYSVDHTSFSLGANYRVTNDLAAFARVSDGVAFNSDRVMFQGYELNGNTIIPINQLKQVEAGFKLRSGSTSAFITFFNARTKETNYEATTQKTTARSYRANGVELEASHRFGDFSIAGGATFTNSKIRAAEDPTLVGKTPRRQADVTYQISPTYNVGPATIGASLIGTSKAFGDDGHTITLPAFSVLNMFVNYQVSQRFSVNLSANNLFNKIGYTEVEGDGHAARSINGRSIKAAVRYTF